MSELSTPIKKAIGEVATSIVNTSQLKGQDHFNAAAQIEQDLCRLAELIIEASKGESR